MEINEHQVRFIIVIFGVTFDVALITQIMGSCARGIKCYTDKRDTSNGTRVVKKKKKKNCLFLHTRF